MTTESPKPENVLPLIERALEWRFALLLLSFVLAIDVARVPLRAFGFPSFNWLASDTSVPLGATLIFATIYLVFMAGFSPFTQAVAEKILKESGAQFYLNRWFGRQREAGREERMYRDGFAPAGDVEALALRQRDELLIKLVKEDSVTAKSEEKSMRFMASVSFSCVFLMLLDIRLIDWASRVDVMQSVWGNAGVHWLVILAVIIVVPSLFLVFWPWLNHLLNGDDIYYQRRWIRHPELAGQVMSKKEEKLAAEDRERLRVFRG